VFVLAACGSSTPGPTELRNVAAVPIDAAPRAEDPPVADERREPPVANPPPTPPPATPRPQATTTSTIHSLVVDTDGDAPLAGAHVMVVPGNVSVTTADLATIDAKAISSGTSDAHGVFTLRPQLAVPATYTIVVMLHGYEPLIGDQVLHLDDQTPASFDPWGKIWLKRAAP
jgi:hypothetical protein